MSMYRGHKIRLYPTKEQSALLENFAMTDDKERLTLCKEYATPVEGESRE